jgi:hypothetical protein
MGYSSRARARAIVPTASSSLWSLEQAQLGGRIRNTFVQKSPAPRQQRHSRLPSSCPDAFTAQLGLRRSGRYRAKRLELGHQTQRRAARARRKRAMHIADPMPNGRGTATSRRREQPHRLERCVQLAGYGRACRRSRRLRGVRWLPSLAPGANRAAAANIPEVEIRGPRVARRRQRGNPPRSPSHQGVV